jgi:hypothetical protein
VSTGMSVVNGMLQHSPVRNNSNDSAVQPNNDVTADGEGFELYRKDMWLTGWSALQAATQ